MNRILPPSQSPARQGLTTGAACCREDETAAPPDALPLAMATIPLWAVGWAGFYRYAYEAAVEQVAAEGRARRLLGHVEPGMN